MVAVSAPDSEPEWADQQIAGLVMWIPGNALYLVAALYVARTWLADSPNAPRQPPTAPPDANPAPLP